MILLLPMAKVHNVISTPVNQILHKDLRKLARLMEDDPAVYRITGNVSRTSSLFYIKDLVGKENFKPNEFIPDLVNAAKLESDMHYRVQALLYLYAIGTDEAESKLIECLESEEIPPSVHHKVAGELVKIDNERALRVLQNGALKLLETPFLGEHLLMGIAELEEKIQQRNAACSKDSRF